MHDKNGLFDESFKSAGDYEFWLRCVNTGSNFGRLNQVLGAYYVNPKGMSTDPAGNKWRNDELNRIYEMHGRE